MSVDHKVFVCCSKDKALEVYGAVLTALREFYRDRIVKLCFQYNCTIVRELPEEIKSKLKNVDIASSNFEHFWIYFSTEKESRNILMSHSCSSDYKEIYDGEKIIFSIGCWGDHQVYMDIIKDAIKDFGDVYEDVNDCDNIDFEKVN